MLSFNGTCTHHCRKKGDILSGIKLPTDLKYTSFSLHYNLSGTVQFKESLHHAWEQSGINQAASGAGLMWNYAWDLGNRKDGFLKQLQILRNYPKKQIYTGECRLVAEQQPYYKTFCAEPRHSVKCRCTWKHLAPEKKPAVVIQGRVSAQWVFSMSLWPWTHKAPFHCIWSLLWTSQGHRSGGKQEIGSLPGSETMVLILAGAEH